MKKMLMAISKIKIWLLCIATSIAVWSCVCVILHNLSIKYIIAYLFSAVLLIGFGRVGILGLSPIKLRENTLFIDVNTFIFVVLDFVAMIAFAVFCAINFYSEYFAIYTFVTASLTIGGITRFYEVERYNIRKIGKKFDEF